MADAVQRLRSNINFWDQICIAARVAILPIYLVWIIVTKPFTLYTRQKPWRRLLGDAALRNMIDIEPKRLKYIMGTTPWVYSAWAKWYNLQETITELGNDARLLWIGPKRMENVILYLHGGGYVFPLQHFSASFWHYVQQELEKRSIKVGIAILNYTRVPTKPFPTSLHQAVSAIHFFLSNGVQPDRIQIVGDSAGGNLVIALLSHMLHPVDGIPPIAPKTPFAGMYMMSPWVRLSVNDDTDDNDGYDVITAPMVKRIGSVVREGLPDHLTPYIEPSVAPDGWFSGAHAYVNRFLISAGDKEYFRNSITELVSRFREENKQTEIEFVVQPDGVHDDPYLDFLVAQPELGVLTPVIVDWIHAGLVLVM